VSAIWEAQNQKIWRKNEQESVVCCIGSVVGHRDNCPVFAVDDALVAAAKEEGTLVSYGLPDSWANYGGIWKIYQELYGIERMDTDMGSGEIIQSLRAEAGAPVADITDLGLNYAKVVEDDNLSQPL
jgi:putative spermidine/putrescine transport system substrate-binding protein